MAIELPEEMVTELPKEMVTELPEELRRGRFQLRSYELNSVERPTRAVRQSEAKRCEVRRGIEAIHEKRQLERELQSF